MPQTIVKPEILELLKTNKELMESIHADNEAHAKKNFELSVGCNNFIALMNEEYGWGNWTDVNAEDATFIPKEEFTKGMYIVHNPAVKERIEPENVELSINTGEQQDAIETGKE